MDTAPGRTVYLRERTPREVRFAPADAAFLAASHRRHVELVPLTRQTYQATARGYVGVIVAPHCRVVLRPKIPLTNLFHLLDPLGTAPSAVDAVTPTDGDPIMNFLAGQLGRLLSERAAAGLHRGYVEAEEAGPFLHGRLNVPAQLRDGPVRKDRLHSRADAFTADVPCNRLPKATAERMLTVPPLGTSVRAALHESLRPFAEAGPAEPTVDAIDRVLSGPVPHEYRPVLGLCRLLVAALSAGENSGPFPVPSFLLDMERVFERYLTARLLAAVGELYCVTAQRLFTVNEPTAGQPDLTVRPDLVFGDDRRALLAIDAKWKRLDGSPLVTPDVYQMLAYCTALGVRHGVLVYPGGRNRTWEYRLNAAPVTLTVRQLRVVGTGTALNASVAGLARLLCRLGDAATSRT